MNRREQEGKEFKLIAKYRACTHLRILVAFLFSSSLASTVGAQEVLSSFVANAVFVTDSIDFEEDSEEALKSSVEHVAGSLMLCGGGPLPAAILETFHRMGSGDQGRLVIIPSASVTADIGDFTPSLKLWSAFSWGNVDVLHALDRGQADADEITEKLRTATAVWIGGGDQNRLSNLYCGTTVEREIQEVIKRGGVVGGTSAGSAIASRVMIAGGTTHPRLTDGLDLLPNAIIDQHFSQRSRYQRLAQAVVNNPGRVGIGIDESTALLIKDKQAQVVGNGSVYFYSKKERAETVVRTVSTEAPVRPVSLDVSESDGNGALSEIRTLKFAPGDTIQSDRSILKKSRSK